MRYLLIFLIYFTFSSLCIGQNLIQNPSFEDTLPRVTPLYLPANWYAPTSGSPDLMTPYNLNNRSAPGNFAGYQNARSGVNYLGLLMYSLSRNNDSKRFREYIQNELIDSLIQDRTYCIQLYVSLADSSKYAAKGLLGIYFSRTAISSNDFYFLPYSPQIIVSENEYIAEKTEWLKFDFEYIANGNEKFITIGNFNDSNVVDTLFAGGSNFLEYKNTYYYIDDIYLGSCDSLPEDSAIGLIENRLESQINLYPNPASNQLFVKYSGNEQLHFRMFNMLGEEVFLETFSRSSTSTNMSIATLPKGIYFLEINSSKSRVTKKFIKN